MRVPGFEKSRIWLRVGWGGSCPMKGLLAGALAVSGGSMANGFPTCPEPDTGARPKSTSASRLTSLACEDPRKPSSIVLAAVNCENKH